MSYDIEIAERRGRPAIVLHGNVTVDSIPAFVAGAIGATAAVVGLQELTFAGPPFGRYTPKADGSFDVEAGFPVAGSPRPAGEMVVTSLPAGTVAHTVHTGSYDTVGLAYEAVEKWLAEHDYVTAGAPWETYLDEPGVPDPRTEICVPCRRADGRPVTRRGPAPR
jgi:effector-binding domain-containing protein